ncbi:MAG: NADH dehydrogenase I chain I, partial [uncultured bacterium]
GMAITSRHLIKNLLCPSRMMTYSWPEAKPPIDSNYRAEHRLMVNADKTIRCTACMLCVTVCPADCIHIVPAEGNHPATEKYAKEYSIDTLRCVYCGLCVEACPCDAIRMDTQKLASVACEREAFVRNIDELVRGRDERRF